MKDLFYIFKNKIWLGIAVTTFLILSPSCALLGIDVDPQDDDPVARAALHGQERLSEDQDQQLQEAQYQKALRRQQALEEGEVVLGMEMKDVISVWGQPQDVETAGDPQLGNQRWIYQNSLFNRWKLKNPKIVFFEGGKVVGWENTQ